MTTIALTRRQRHVMKHWKQLQVSVVRFWMRATMAPHPFGRTHCRTLKRAEILHSHINGWLLNCIHRYGFVSIHPKAFSVYTIEAIYGRIRRVPIRQTTPMCRVLEKTWSTDKKASRWIVEKLEPMFWCCSMACCCVYGYNICTHVRQADG